MPGICFGELVSLFKREKLPVTEVQICLRTVKEQPVSALDIFYKLRYGQKLGK
jgi:hypothetical protein